MRLERAQPLGLFLFEALHVPIEIGSQLFDFFLIGPFLAADLGFGVLLDGADKANPLIFVHVDDDVLGEVQDLLERARGHVQQQTDAAGRALDEPDVADGRGQLDVAHPFAADFGARDLDAALVADDALITNPLVLAAGAFPVLLRAKDALAEQTVALGLERAVVDGFGLGDFAAGPRSDLFGRGEGDPNGVEIVDFEHYAPTAWVAGREPAHIDSPPRSNPLMLMSSDRTSPPSTSSAKVTSSSSSFSTSTARPRSAALSPAP